MEKWTCSPPGPSEAIDPNHSLVGSLEKDILEALEPDDGVANSGELFRRSSNPWPMPTPASVPVRAPP